MSKFSTLSNVWIYVSLFPYKCFPETALKYLERRDIGDYAS